LLRHLLTHTSGLPAWRPLYLLAKDREEVIAAIANQPLAYQPGERVVYSDLGFIVLGIMLQNTCRKIIAATLPTRKSSSL
jgi:CubicO group peptidase (beta-lactamase class C family)